jgi:hypothetical protein
MGAGFGRVIINADIIRDGKPWHTRIGGPHNQLLFVLDECGLVGVIALLSFGIAVARILLRAGDWISLKIFAGWASLFLAGMADTMFGISSPEYGPINCVLGVLIGATVLTADSRMLGARKYDESDIIPMRRAQRPLHGLQ